jgi:hypothetical protein
MNKHSIKRHLISWGLLFSLLVPLTLDAMHYAIFHHDDHDSYNGINFQKEKEAHILCNYPFVTEELSESAIAIQHFERVLEIWFPAEMRVSEHISFYPNPLRGPPSLT